MFELAIYILTIAYLTKIFLLEHQHYFFKEAKPVLIQSQSEMLARHFDLLDIFRQKILSYEDRQTHYLIPHTGLSQLFLCPYCLSFWLNLILLPLLSVITHYPTTYYFFLLFAVPYIVGFLYER